jgi:hypothetical protein
LGFSAGLIGAVYSAGTVGGLLAAATARRIGLRIGPGRSIVTGSTLRSAGMMLLPVAVVAGSFAVPVVFISRLVNAFGWTLWDVHQETTKQRLLSDVYRGRANAAVLFIFGTALAVGSAAGAGLVALTTVPVTLAVCAPVTLAAPAWLMLRGALGEGWAAENGR